MEPLVVGRYDEDSDTFHIGIEHDGAFVSFVSVPGPQVRTNAENLNAARSDAPADGSAA